MQKLALISCVLFLTISCVTTWDWVADPYTYDATADSLVNAEGVFCAVTEECMHNFISFTYENIQALEENIERLELKEEYKGAIIQEVKKLYGVRYD